MIDLARHTLLQAPLYAPQDEALSTNMDELTVKKDNLKFVSQ